MKNNSFTNEKNEQYARACLAFAKKLGLIDDDSLEGVKKRCEAENAKREAQQKDGEIFYGLTHFSFPAYLQHELTGFKLDFASENEKIKRVYNYKDISDRDTKAYYKNNRDLFTRYNGERFTYKEVKMIIKKKMREEEYENEINNILCQLADR
ncbi:MAG: hypothetical protein ACI4RR_07055 [Eubacterium sp.]